MSSKLVRLLNESGSSESIAQLVVSRQSSAPGVDTFLNSPGRHLHITSVPLSTVRNFRQNDRGSATGKGRHMIRWCVICDLVRYL